MKKYYVVYLVGVCGVLTGKINGDIVDTELDKEALISEWFDKGYLITNIIDLTTKTNYDELLEKYKNLKKEYDIVYDDLMYMNVWQCPKCGHYSMQDYVCHECGYDKSE